MIDQELAISKPELADVYYTYSPAQQEQRAKIIKLIEAEKRAYYERVEPLVQRLAAIQGTPHVVIKNSPR